MYTHKLNRLGKNTVEIGIVIEKATIDQEYKASFAKLLQNLEIKGFRRGKVPPKIAEQYLKKESIYEEIVKKEGLKPVMHPKIELAKAKENEDWQIKITLAEKPSVELGDFKETIRKIKAEQKKTDIWVPGKPGEKQEVSEKDKAKKQQELLNSILNALLKETKCEISELIIEEELNQRLSNLLTEIQKIGLTVDTYLKSKNLTQEELKKRYRNEIEQTYKLEFILGELADKENIKVENSDIEKLLLSINDPKERETAKANSYFYASVLRKQKTLDYLLSI